MDRSTGGQKTKKAPALNSQPSEASRNERANGTDHKFLKPTVRETRPSWLGENHKEVIAESWSRDFSRYLAPLLKGG
ncbi:MAG TPA: hypothetical protein DIW81_16955 [Planctomycetaceae bacterium]|nr:hypothetical protein [Planctomycetaceae bacterium]